MSVTPIENLELDKDDIGGYLYNGVIVKCIRVEDKLMFHRPSLLKAIGKRTTIGSSQRKHIKYIDTVLYERAHYMTVWNSLCFIRDLTTNLTPLASNFIVEVTTNLIDEIVKP